MSHGSSCRTGHRSDSQLLSSLSRVTLSAASEHVSELLGCPISRSLPTSCVCLELRPLPSTGITRLQRYYGPLRHPSAPGLSLAGVRLIIPDHALGLPVLRALSLCTCCRHYPGAAAGRTPRSSHPAVSAFPGRVAGSACTSSFSRLAQRLLALRPAHSRGHQFVTRYPKASDISSPPCLLRLLPAGANRRVGLAPTGKRRLVTAHTHSGPQSHTTAPKGNIDVTRFGCSVPAHSGNAKEISHAAFDAHWTCMPGDRGHHGSLPARLALRRPRQSSVPARLSDRGDGTTPFGRTVIPARRAVVSVGSARHQHVGHEGGLGGTVWRR